MDDGVVALIIVSGFVVGGLFLGTASFRKTRRRKQEIQQMAQALQAQWVEYDANAPAWPTVDVLSRQPYSNSGRPYERGFEAMYRGRVIVCFEYRSITRSANGGRRNLRHHVIKVVGPNLPTLVMRPQQDIPSEMFAGAGLQTVPTGKPEFDNAYDIRATGPDAAGRVITKPVFDWLLAQSQPLGRLVVASPSGLEVRGGDALPGWDTATTVNQLCDLADLIDYGVIPRGPRLEQQSTRPVGNRVLTTVGAIFCVAAAVFWIAAYTVSDPSGGLVVILVIGGLIGAGVTIERLLNRRARRKRAQAAAIEPR